MQHSVMHDDAGKFVKFRFIGKVAVVKKIADFKKSAFFSELLDWIASISQDPFVAVKVSNGASAAGSRHKARVVGEVTQFCIELANINGCGSFMRPKDR